MGNLFAIYNLKGKRKRFPFFLPIHSPMDKALLKPLLEKGVLVFCLAIAIYFLWSKTERSENEIRKQITTLQDENQECSLQYKNLILDQWKLSNQIIDKNTQIIHELETKIFTR